LGIRISEKPPHAKIAAQAGLRLAVHSVHRAANCVALEGGRKAHATDMGSSEGRFILAFVRNRAVHRLQYRSRGAKARGQKRRPGY
jgi:hypothetical protein